ncbi:hypothetical protein OTU49_015389, partial [Cherax quadricarinatus]
MTKTNDDYIRNEEQDCKRDIEGILQICNSYDEALHLLQTEEKATGMHFVGHRKEGIFDMIGSDMKEFIGEGRKHIKYSASVETKGRGNNPVPVRYTGVPFIEAGTYIMECHMGHDSGVWKKRRYAANRDKKEAGVMVQKGKDKTLHLLQIKKYLETGAYLSSVLSNEKKGIRVAAKAFRIE